MSADLIYRRVPVAVWTELAGLPSDAVVLMMRMLTGPETTQIPGVVTAGRAGLAEALGWTIRRLGRAIHDLEHRGLIVIDWEARIAWIPTALASATVANPSIVTGWRSVWAQIPRCRLRDETIAAALMVAVTARGDSYVRALRGVLGDTVSPMVSPTVPPTVGDIGSGSGSGSGVGPGGGGGTAAASCSLRDPGWEAQRPGGDPGREGEPGPERDPHLEAFRRARAEAVARNPRISTSEAPRDLKEFREAVARLEITPELVGATARIYFARKGRDPKDTWWSDGGWSLHLLSTQGLDACVAQARAGGSGDWTPSEMPDDSDRLWQRELDAKGKPLRRNGALGHVHVGPGMDYHAGEERLRKKPIASSVAAPADIEIFDDAANVAGGRWR